MCTVGQVNFFATLLSFTNGHERAASIAFVVKNKFREEATSQNIESVNNKDRLYFNLSLGTVRKYYIWGEKAKFLEFCGHQKICFVSKHIEEVLRMEHCQAICEPEKKRFSSLSS